MTGELIGAESSELDRPTNYKERATVKRFCNFCGTQIPQARFNNPKKRALFCGDLCRFKDANQRRRSRQAQQAATRQLHACKSTRMVSMEATPEVKQIIFGQLIERAYEFQQSKAKSPIEGKAQESESSEHSSNDKGVGVSAVQ